MAVHWELPTMFICTRKGAYFVSAFGFVLALLLLIDTYGTTYSVNYLQTSQWRYEPCQAFMGYEKFWVRNDSRTHSSESSNSETKTKSLHTDYVCEPKIPRIVHMVWLHSRPTTYRFYHLISALSVLKFITPKQILFHHNTLPTGEYWTYFLSAVKNTTTELVFLKRESPTVIFGQSVQVPEHRSDVARLEAILCIGGIYLDSDVIVIQPLDRLLCYDVVMGEESPSALCNGVIMGTPRAPFLNTWYNTYRGFDDSKWSVQSVFTPASIARRHPNWIHIEHDSMHKPTWRPEHIQLIYTPGKTFPWRSKYTVHLWYRMYKKEHNPTDIKLLNNTLGEIFRYIYYGSSDKIHS